MGRSGDANSDDCCAGCRTWPPIATTFFRVAVILTGLGWIMSICAIAGVYWVGFSPTGDPSGISRRGTLYRFDLHRMTWCSSEAFCDEFFNSGIRLQNLPGTAALISASSTVFSMFLTSLLVCLATLARLALTSCLRQRCCDNCCGSCCPIVTVPCVKDPLFLSWTRLSAVAHIVVGAGCFYALRMYTAAAGAAFPAYAQAWYLQSIGGSSNPGSVNSWSYTDGYNCALTAAIFHAVAGVLFAWCVYLTRDLDGGSTVCGVGSGAATVQYGQAGRQGGGGGAGRPSGYSNSGGAYGVTVQPSPLQAYPVQAAMGGVGGEGLPMPMPMAVPTAAVYGYATNAAGGYAPQVYANAGPTVISMQAAGPYHGGMMMPGQGMGMGQPGVPGVYGMPQQQGGQGGYYPPPQPGGNPYGGPYGQGYPPSAAGGAGYPPHSPAYPPPAPGGLGMGYPSQGLGGAQGMPMYPPQQQQGYPPMASAPAKTLD